MITKEEINNYIKRVPPVPQVLKETIMQLNAGNLVKAAEAATKDRALSQYLKVLVNKPIYGFKNEVSEPSQIFGILGVSGSQQALYNYMMTLLSPSKWVLFKLNRVLFYNLQADLSIYWDKILKFLNRDDKEVLSAITLLPASIIVAEALFSQKKKDVELLRTVHAIDFNTILKRVGGIDLFDIAEQISKRWEMESKIADIIQASSGKKPSDDAEINLLGKWMHLLLFYTLSKPQYIDAQLNDFIDFQIDYVQDIYDDFSQLMEIA